MKDYRNRVVCGATVVAFFSVLCCGLVWGGEASQPGVDEIVSRMQSRAGKVGSLSGVVARRVTSPVAGQWKRDPFQFQAPDRFLQKTGWSVESPGAEPVKEKNAWHIVRGGVEYRRRGGRTYRVRPGSSWEELAYGTGPETLLMVNLMPGEWFGALEKRLRVGPVEESGGTTYYTLVETRRNRDRHEALVRYHDIRNRRLGRARKYYVNSETFVCERIVLGNQEGPETESTGLEDPTGDITASDIQEVGGGGLLPLSYERRSFGEDGEVYQSVAMEVEDLTSRSKGAFSDAEFSPQGRTPGQDPIVLRPMADFEELREKVKTDPTPSDVLTLASMYAGMKFSHGRKGLKVLERGDELFKGRKPQGYGKIRKELARKLKRALAKRQKREAPQLEKIYRRRAQRFRRQGDSGRAEEMSSRADSWQKRAKEAKQKLKELR
jgi:hypothetical protein